MIHSIFSYLPKATAYAFIASLGLASVSTVSAGDVTGKARLDGPRPEREPMEMRTFSLTGRDSQDCLKWHASEPALSEEEIVAEDGGIQNVFVYISDGVEEEDFETPEEAAHLNQKMCMFHPRVQGVMVGQDIDITNSDETSHNVRCFAKRNAEFNIGQPVPGTRTKSFRRAENGIKFKCDIHRWMTAYLFVMEHPYFATTDETGSFTIKNLPEGEYTITGWHEVYEEVEAELKVGKDGAKDIELVFKPVDKDS